MYSQFELFTEAALLDRLVATATGAERPVTFLVGSPLTAPLQPGLPGVPDVGGMIELVRDALRLPQWMPSGESGNPYQEAFRTLLASRGPESVSRVVRQAVLNAIIDAAPAVLQAAVDGDALERRRACDLLERNLRGWSLGPGVECLGRIVAAFPICFGQALLTSNFDPLIEISIRRAGGACWRTAPHGDGSLQHSRGQGCHVVHVHGYWYDVDTLHIPTQLQAERPQLQASLRRLFEDTTLVVVAYGGWDDVFSKALIDVVGDGGAFPEVIWTFRDSDGNAVSKRYARLLERLRPGFERAGRVTLYGGIDCHTLFRKLWGRLPAALNLGSWELLQAERQGLLHELHTMADDLAGQTGEQLVTGAIERLQAFSERFVRPGCGVALVARSTPDEFMLRGISDHLPTQVLDRLSRLSVGWGDGLRPWSYHELLGDDEAEPLGQAGVAIPLLLPGQKFSGHIFFLHEVPFSPSEVWVLREAGRTIAIIIKTEQDRLLLRAAVNRYLHSLVGPLQGLISESRLLAELAAAQTPDTQSIRGALRRLDAEAEAIRTWRANQQFYLSSTLEARPRIGSLRKVVSGCIDRFHDRMAQRGITLELHWDAPSDVTFGFDPGLLDLALSNLLDNAYQYSFHRQRVILGARLEPDYVVIWVQNLGHPIPSSLGDEIFDKGKRAPLGDSLRAISGSGLGLTVAAAVVRAHGGRISYTSDPVGEGGGGPTQIHLVKFTIRLPHHWKS